MITETHTPTPSEALARYNLQPKSIYWTSEQLAEDQASIVRACNSHHALLQAVVNLKAIIEGFHSPTGPDQFWQWEENVDLRQRGREIAAEVLKQAGAE